MNKNKNVIDLSARRGIGTLAAGATGGQPSARRAMVLDMTERRNEILTHERRKVRRTILTEFIGAHVIVPNRGLQKATLYDISESGIAFDLEPSEGGFKVGDEVGFRLYMNRHTYFPFVVKVANVREIVDEGVIRHGGEFVKGTINDVALHHFIKFIETVSASLRTDSGDVMVSGIRG